MTLGGTDISHQGAGEIGGHAYHSIRDNRPLVTGGRKVTHCGPREADRQSQKRVDKEIEIVICAIRFAEDC